MASYPGSVKTFATRSAGQTIDASHVNDLQDEVNAIENGLLNGGAPINSSRITATALSVSAGSTLTTLTATGIVTGSAQPRCRLYNVGAQTIGNASLTPLTWDSEEYDVGGMHSTASNPSRITVPAGGDGLYLLIANVAFAANSTGGRDALLLKNSSQIAYHRVHTVDANIATFQVMAMTQAVAGDFFVADVIQSCSSNLATSTGNEIHWFSAAKLW
jgi:hypothetical protein